LNLLTPKRPQIKKSHSMASSTTIVEIELWSNAALSGDAKERSNEYSERPENTQMEKEITVG
jgi:hypothetical protein